MNYLHPIRNLIRNMTYQSSAVIRKQVVPISVPVSKLYQDDEIENEYLEKMSLQQAYGFLPERVTLSQPASNPIQLDQVEIDHLECLSIQHSKCFYK